MKFILLILLFAVTEANAATYYIDYVGGNDSNSGTSKSAPWKRHPYSNDFTGSGYSHSAGDRFIFKGGVKWPHNGCYIQLAAGGSSPSNRDYYGVDLTWFNGAAFTKPILSGEGTAARPQIVTNPHSYVLIDNLEFTGYYWNDTQGRNTIGVGVSTYITVQNSYFHGWKHGPNAGDGYQCMAGSAAAPYNVGCELLNSVADGAEDGGNSGAVLYDIPIARNNTVRNMSNGFLVNRDPIVTGNNIGPIRSSFDPNQHPNAIESINGGNMLIDSNVVHDAVFPLYFGGGTIKVTNNLFYNNTAQPTVNYDPSTAMYILNNTFVNCVTSARAVNRAGTTPTLHYVNNHEISSGSHLENSSGNGAVGTVTASNQVVQSNSTASAQGFTEANLWQPTGNSVATYNAGTNKGSVMSALDRLGVARPQFGTWDVGCYEFSSTGPQPTPSPTATPVPTPTPLPTPPPVIPTMPGLTFEAEAGLIAAPFVVTGGAVTQPVQTGIADSGSARYKVNIPVVGNYNLRMNVNAADPSSDSLFVDFDKEPVDPASIWDVQDTVGVEPRVVTWRGNGSVEAPEFHPMIWTLSAGTHTLIIRGREAGLSIDAIEIVTPSTPTPTPSPSPTATPTPQPTPTPPPSQIQIGDVQGLQQALDGKADKGHTHPVPAVQTGQ